MSDRATGWLKLDLQLEQLVEPVAVETGVGPVALAYWTALLIEAKTSERFGYVETTARRFARRVFETRARPSLWQAFADEGLIELVEGTFEGRFVIRMHELFFDEQVERPKTAADRAREYRRRQKAASERGERHTERVTEDVTTVTNDTDASRRLETRDLRHESSVPNGTVPSVAKKKTTRVAALTDEQIAEQIESCRQTLNGLSPLVDQLVDAAARERKRGQVSAAVVLRELWLPITAMLEDMPRPALRHGLEAAVARPAPNARYVKKAASGYVPTPVNAEANNSNGASNGNGHGQQYAAADLVW